MESQQRTYSKKLYCSQHGYKYAFKCQYKNCSNSYLCGSSQCLENHFHLENQGRLIIVKFDSTDCFKKFGQLQRLFTKEDFSGEAKYLKTFIDQLKLSMVSIYKDYKDLHEKKNFFLSQTNKPFDMNLMQKVDETINIGQNIRNTINSIKSKLNLPLSNIQSHVIQNSSKLSNDSLINLPNGCQSPLYSRSQTNSQKKYIAQNDKQRQKQQINHLEVSKQYQQGEMNLSQENNLQTTSKNIKINTTNTNTTSSRIQNNQVPIQLQPSVSQGINVNTLVNLLNKGKSPSTTSLQFQSNSYLQNISKDSSQISNLQSNKINIPINQASSIPIQQPPQKPISIQTVSNNINNINTTTTSTKSFDQLFESGIVSGNSKNIGNLLANKPLHQQNQQLGSGKILNNNNSNGINNNVIDVNSPIRTPQQLTNESNHQSIVIEQNGSHTGNYLSNASNVLKNIFNTPLSNLSASNQQALKIYQRNFFMKKELSMFLQKNIKGFSWGLCEEVYNNFMPLKPIDKFHQMLEGKRHLMFIFVAQNRIIGSYYPSRYPRLNQKLRNDPNSFLFISNNQKSKIFAYKAVASQFHLSVSDKLYICHGNTPSYADGIRTFQKNFSQLNYCLPSVSFKYQPQINDSVDSNDSSSKITFNGVVKVREFFVLQFAGESVTIN